MSILSNTLSTLRTALRLRLNETVAGVWSDDDCNRWVNRAILRIAMDTETDTAEATVSLRQNVAHYSLPSDCIVPLFLYGPSTWSYERLFPTSIVNLDKNIERVGQWERSGSARSTVFIPFSYDRFWLWPPPSTSTSVTLFYIPIPSTLSADASTTVFNLHTQDLIPIYAAYLALRKYDFRKAKLMLSEYKQRLSIVKSEHATNSAMRTTRMAPTRSFDQAHRNAITRMR